MKKPLTIEIDFETGAAYLRYRSARIAETHEVWKEGVVAADIDRDGEIAGIEVLDFDIETLARARAYAADHDLVFPANRDFGL